MSGKDHRNDRSVVRNVKAGVCESFMIRVSPGLGEVCEPGDLVVQADDQPIERPGGAEGDVVRPVIGLLFEEHDGLVLLVKDDMVDEVDTDGVDNVVGYL